MKPKIRTLALAAALAVSSAAFAQVTVKDPWVRGTVAQQKASGAFMLLQSATDARLVSAASPVAGVVEIHEMKMEGDVMRMRAITGLDLPAGSTVELKPGGYHVMLMDLKKPLQDGDMVPLTLTVEGKDGKRSTLEVQAPVKALAAPAGGHMMRKH
ncbi:MAG: copper chaperone PCu(A)C [Gammaproteobacteria bacterium]